VEDRERDRFDSPADGARAEVAVRDRIACVVRVAEVGGGLSVRAGFRRGARRVLPRVADPVRLQTSLGRQECGENKQDRKPAAHPAHESSTSGRLKMIPMVAFDE
jgi:hypothetical protein